MAHEFLLEFLGQFVPKLIVIDDKFSCSNLAFDASDFSSFAMLGPAASRLWPSVADGKALFDPVMAFMGNRGEEPRDRGDDGNVEVSEKLKSLEHFASGEKQDDLSDEVSPVSTSEKENLISETMGRTDVESSLSSLSMTLRPEVGKAEPESNIIQVEEDLPVLQKHDPSFEKQSQSNENEFISIVGSQSGEIIQESSADIEQDNVTVLPVPDSSHAVVDSHKIHDKQETEEGIPHSGSPEHFDTHYSGQLRLEEKSPGSTSTNISKIKDLSEVGGQFLSSHSSLLDSAKELPVFSASNELTEVGSPMKVSQGSKEANYKSMLTGLSDSRDLFAELEIIKKEKEMMEAALQGAARQAQV